MAVSTHLFELIQSLTSSEKRYFRLFCKFQGGEKNYIRLFDFLEKQSTYDEVKIQEHFKGETFLKNLHVTKHYLYGLIMKSLRSFHAQHYVDQKIGDHIADMLLLEGRGLYQQARQSLFKAKKIAYKFHRYHYLVFLLKKEASFHFAINGKKLKSQIEKINQELKLANDTLQEESMATALYYQAVFLTRGRSGESTDLEDLKGQLNLFHQQPDQVASPSFYTIYRKDSIQAAIAYEEGHEVNRYLSTQKIVQHWQAHPQMISAEPHLYQVQLANFLNAAFQHQKYDEFPSILEELSQLPSRNFNEAAENFQNLAFYQLLYFLNTQKLDNAQATLTSIFQGLEKYRSKINKARELAFYYNISILYFTLKEIDHALLWLNKILNHPKTDHRKDIQRFAEILQLFYHYNLNNYELLYHMTTSVRKKIHRWRPLSAFEKLILDQLRQLLQINSQKEKSAVLKQFRDQLTSFKQSNEEHIPIGYDEIVLWLDQEMG